MFGSTVLFLIGNLTIGLSDDIKYLSWRLNAFLFIVYYFKMQELKELEDILSEISNTVKVTYYLVLKFHLFNDVFFIKC